MSAATTTTRPPLAALVYRANKGCAQYSFGTADELEAWAARHPYRNETLRIFAVKSDGKLTHAHDMPANEAAAHVRKIRSEPAATHTPGPWKTGKSGITGTYVNSDSVTIAFCGVNGTKGADGWYNITPDEAAANASVCAAALDLLAACKALLRDMQAVDSAGSFGLELQVVMDQAHRAIAKAERLQS